jgi:hypothetical protein
MGQALPILMLLGLESSINLVIQIKPGPKILNFQGLTLLMKYLMLRATPET